MNNQRIDIDKNRWIELRDELFVYVRTYGRHRLDITVAPWERVSVPRRSAFPAIRTIPFVSYSALFGAPLFAICALVMLAANRDTPLQALGWALILSLGLTVLFAAAMLLIGRIKGRRETMLYAAGNVYSPMIHLKHDEGANPELDAFLDALPIGYGNVPAHVPLGELFRLQTPLRFVLEFINVTCYLYLLWSLSLEAALEATALLVLFAGFFAVFLAVNLAKLGAQLYLYFRDSIATKEARAALLDGDYAAAELILNAALEKSPRQPYPNYLLMAIYLVHGDLAQAAACAEIVEQSRIMRFLPIPVSHMAIYTPTAERLHALDAYVHAERHATKSTDEGRPDRIEEAVKRW